MKLLSVGYDFRHDADFKLLRPNGLNEYLLLIIRSKAYFEIEGKRLKIMPNSMILVDKNTPHSFYADKETYINDWITFDLTTEEYSAFIEQHIKVNTFFALCNIEFFSDIIKLMQTEVQTVGIDKSGNMDLFFRIVLNKLQDNSMYLNFDKKYYNELLKIRNGIYSYPQKEYTIEQLSLEVNLSKSYFQHLYKLYFNTTPISDAIKSRIEYSKQLLTSTCYSVSEVAELSGYKDDAQFIKQFKSIAGITPNKYRKGFYKDMNKT